MTFEQSIYIILRLSVVAVPVGAGLYFAMEWLKRRNMGLAIKFALFIILVACAIIVVNVVIFPFRDWFFAPWLAE